MHQPTTGDDPIPMCLNQVRSHYQVSLLKQALPEIPDYPLFTGVRANSMAFNFARSGEAQITVGLDWSGRNTTKCDNQ